MQTAVKSLDDFVDKYKKKKKKKNSMTDNNFAEKNGAYSRALRTRVYFRKHFSGVLILKKPVSYIFFPVVI